MKNDFESLEHKEIALEQQGLNGYSLLNCCPPVMDHGKGLQIVV